MIYSIFLLVQSLHVFIVCFLCCFDMTFYIAFVLLILTLKLKRENIIFIISWVEQLIEQQRVTRHLYNDQKIYERFEVKIDLTLKYGKLI